MRIKCVFGHAKRVVLACCERAITFIPEIIWRVTICWWQSLALASEVGLQQHMYIFSWYEIK